MCFIFYIYFVQEYGLVQKTAGLSFETSDSAIVVTLGTLLLTKLVCSCSSDISFFFFFKALLSRQAGIRGAREDFRSGEGTHYIFISTYLHMQILGIQIYMQIMYICRSISTYKMQICRLYVYVYVVHVYISNDIS